MKSKMQAVLCAALATTLIVELGTLHSHAQTAASAIVETLNFDFERAGLPVPRFQLLIQADGSASYRPTSDTGTDERKFNLSAAEAQKIFALARGLQLSDERCAAKAKNIADTGTKRLTYSSGGESHSCTYNYSENKSLLQLTSILIGVSETLEFGRTLDHLHRYDRLGLDAAMTNFAEAIEAGRAAGPELISSTLRSIADDPEVMQRVRIRAAKLLDAPSDTASR